MEEFEVTYISYGNIKRGQHSTLILKTKGREVKKNFNFYSHVKRGDIVKLYNNDFNMNTLVYPKKTFKNIIPNLVKKYNKDAIEKIQVTEMTEIKKEYGDSYIDLLIKYDKGELDQPLKLMMKLHRYFVKDYIYRCLKLLNIRHYDVLNLDWNCCTYYEQLLKNAFYVPTINNLDKNRRKEIYFYTHGYEPNEMELMSSSIHDEIYKMNCNGYSGVDYGYIKNKYDFIDIVLEALPEIFILYYQRVYYRHVYNYYKIIANKFKSLKGLSNVKLKKYGKLDKVQASVIKRSLISPVSVISGEAGSGKCLHPDQKVLIYFEDTIKSISCKDVKIGDYLVSPIKDYKAKVISVTNGIDMMYKVTKSDGNYFICNSCHIMTVIDDNNILYDIPINKLNFNINFYLLKLIDSENFIKQRFTIEKIGRGYYNGFTLNKISNNNNHIFTSKNNHIFKGNHIFTIKNNHIFKGNHFLLEDKTITHNTTCLTTLQNTLINEDINFEIVAPTGCAVSKINEVSKKLYKEKDIKKTSVTLHKLAQRKKIISNVECLIIDEFSMVVASILSRVLKYCKSLKSIIFVGDLNQLPPIGCGDVIRECILFNLIECNYLKYCYRVESKIIKKICDSLLEKHNLDYKEWYSDNLDNSQLIRGNIFAVQSAFLYLINNIKDFKLENFVALGCYNKDVDKMNDLIKEAYSEKFDSYSVTNSDGKTFMIGDPVIHIVNKSKEDIYNGMRGIIVYITKNYLIVKYDNVQYKYFYNYEKDYLFDDFENDYELENILDYEIDSNFDKDPDEVFEIDSNEEIVNDYSSLNVIRNTRGKIIVKNKKPYHYKNLEIAYSMTVNKAQGSEYDYVIFYLSHYKKNFININRLYTSLSRAKKRIYFISNLDFNSLFYFIDQYNKIVPINSSINFSPFYFLMNN